MAKKKQNIQNKGADSVETNVFVKGMNKDINPSYEPKQSWTHARNAANNSTDGDVGVLGNEPANLACGVVPYTVIGTVHLYADEWVLYTTDNTNSEIGLFDDSKCEYKTLVNSKCLNFNKENLIQGAAKENFDCSWQVYWDDGRNPSRTLNLDNIPYQQTVTSTPGDDCVIYEDTTILDCEKLRLAPLLDTPIVKLSKAPDGGSLRNGMYQAYIAYTVNEQRVTDYIGVSNLQSLFDHDGTAGSLDIKVSNLDKDFEFFELVILSNNANNYAAKKIGLYSTETSSISVDYIDQSLVSIPLELLPARSPAYEKSDAMFVVNDWLIRKGPTEQFDFNYQPRANQIKTEWVVAEYPAEYYRKGGNSTGFMRDEQYAFFIRWIYNTGERSKSYHIPGRPPKSSFRNQFNEQINSSEDGLAGGGGLNVLSSREKNFQVYDTSTIQATGLNNPTGDGGLVIAKGEMSYWQSTEKYPATQPEIWNATYTDVTTGVNIGGTGDSRFDLCGKYIRHHKMPTEERGPELHLTNDSNSRIRVLGVQFSDIKPPVFNDGTVIPNIVGYEILRGSREGQKSILAKGIFRNMRKYNIPEGEQTGGNPVGLYPNYPYNDLRPDVYFHDGQRRDDHRTDGTQKYADSIDDFKPLTSVAKKFFTFHSPELMFKRPFLNAYETRLYGDLSGTSVGHFIKSENHPQNKLIRNIASIIASIIGIGYAISRIRGTQESELQGLSINNNLVANDYLDVDVLGVGGGASVPYVPFVGPPGTGALYETISAEQGINLGVGSLFDLLGEILLQDVVDISTIWLGQGAVDLTMSFGQGKNLTLASRTPGTDSGKNIERFKVEHPSGNLPKFLQAAFGYFIARFNIADGGNEIIELIYGLIKEEDFAFKHNSHGFYDTFTTRPNGQVYRTRNEDSNYIGSTYQAFNGFKINNLFRPDTVAVATTDNIDDPSIVDKSRYVISGDGGGPFSESVANKYLRNPEQEQKRDISAVYGALKFDAENQYGQLDGIKQVQMRGTIELVSANNPQTKFSSSPIFAGDVYINRYTEKTIMPIFADFLNGQPDQYTYDYLQRVNIPYPRYWMDTRKFDMTSLANEIVGLSLPKTSDPLPSDLFYLDRHNASIHGSLNIFDGDNDPNPVFAMRYGYMYTHVNGIQDFFVESEYNLAQRDWEEAQDKRFYDPYEYANTDDLFHADIIKKDNYYKYDISLSVSKFLTQISNFGEVQTRDYDPKVAEDCFSYYPKRLIYSLQAKTESKKDFWRVFLPNNYKDFKNPINVIKPINKSGALVLFPYQSPQMFQGLDTLKTDLGTKLTIGDGGLFSQPFQNITNSDLSNEYGSCESHRTVINTPMGVFFISQAQGKIFHYTGKLENIANNGMKWWFNKYLPSQLIKQFPALEETPLADNPVVGVGCQSIYDVNNDVVYFCKRDFRVKDQYKDQVNYTVQNGFTFNGFVLQPQVNDDAPILSTKITLGDPLYFEDVSWTVSYDPKAKAWISFHDWHPELCMPSINHFLTTKEKQLDQPYCPPGYSYNPVTQNCEITIGDSAPAIVNVEEVLANLQTQTCDIDLVLCMDYSASTNANQQSILKNQHQFISDFLDNSDVQSALSSGRLQMGFTAFGSAESTFMNLRTSGNVQKTMANTFDPDTVIDGLGFSSSATAYYNTLDPSGQKTNFCRGIYNAFEVLNSKSTTELGDRSGNANFIQAVIVITDARCRANTTSPPNSFNEKNNCRAGGSSIGMTYQSSLLGGGGPANQYIYTVWCGENQDVFDSQGNIKISDDCANATQGIYPFTGNDILDNLTGDANTPNRQNQYIILSQQPLNDQKTDYVAQQIINSICSFSCSCPTGYTLVYPGNNGYTEPTGDCNDVNPPICRKIGCECPPPINPKGLTTKIGNCDDVYKAGPNGDPNYVNPNPVICSFFYEDITPAVTTGSGIWRHNYRCDLFANYYGVDYPWEVELVENTGQNVNTVRSLEYQLESYVYKGDLHDGCGDDRWHDLDFNFDELIVHNTEQVSGLLRIHNQFKNDPMKGLEYPKVNLSDIEILSSKVEQKYRINQFWDTTHDRGEFSNAQQEIFKTRRNGYIRDLNSGNLDYSKSAFERKKFRHYYNKFLLTRRISADRKMLLKLNNTKLNLSFR